MKLLKTHKIYVAGHRGLVGSALIRNLESRGYANILTRTHAELDLTDQKATFDFLESERPDAIVLAAARVGGIQANNTYRGEFIYQNLAIASNVIHGAHLADINTPLFGFKLHLPQTCATADEGRASPDRQLGTNQRALRHCQNCRT